MLQLVNGIGHYFKQYNDCIDNSNQRGALILKNIKFTSTVYTFAMLHNNNNIKLHNFKLDTIFLYNVSNLICCHYVTSSLYSCRNIGFSTDPINIGLSLS